MHNNIEFDITTPVTGTTELIEVDISDMVLSGVLSTVYSLRCGLLRCTEDQNLVVEKYVNWIMVKLLADTEIQLSSVVTIRPPEHNRFLSEITALCNHIATCLDKHSRYSLSSVIDGRMLYLYLGRDLMH